MKYAALRSKTCCAYTTSKQMCYTHDISCLAGAACDSYSCKSCMAAFHYKNHTDDCTCIEYSHECLNRHAAQYRDKVYESGLMLKFAVTGQHMFFSKKCAVSVSLIGVIFLEICPQSSSCVITDAYSSCHPYLQPYGASLLFLHVPLFWLFPS